MLPRPASDQLALLTPFERFAFHVADGMNRHELLKRGADRFLRSVGAAWVGACTKNLLHVHGLEHVRSLSPERGVMIAANHRSFFDLYVVMAVLYRQVDWVRHVYFPVRSSYFYERPDGIAVNAAMSAMAMYPPIFRDQSKRGMNQWAIDALSAALREPGNVVGFHPEGTRNKTEDPYTLLPAKPGTGQLVHAASPIVLPVFTLGPSNDFVRQIRSNFDGTGMPITVVFGAPLRLDDEQKEPAKLRTYMRVANRLRDVLTELGQEEKAIRARDGLPALGVAEVVTVGGTKKKSAALRPFTRRG